MKHLEIGSWLSRLVCLGGFVLTACATTSPPTKGTSSTTVTTSAESPAQKESTTNNTARSRASSTSSSSSSRSSSSTHCEGEVVCDGARVVPQRADEWRADYNTEAVANADRVFASMHRDLLACYRARLAVDPGAHAFLTIDVVIGPDGRVRHVETTGGARLGKNALDCIVHRVESAAFDPIPGGGTRRIQAPFTLRRVGLDESI